MRRTSRNSRYPRQQRWSRPPKPFAIGDAWLDPSNNHCPPTSWAARMPQRCCAHSWSMADFPSRSRALEEPDMWGMLLVDIARHASRAYARESDYTEQEALARIIEMFEAEIAR